MAKVEVSYGGETYRILDHDVEDVVELVEKILQSGRPGWIAAYDGHGSSVPIHLLITPGVSFALASLSDSTG